MTTRKKAVDRLTDAFVRLAENVETPEDRGGLVADITFIYAEVLSTIVATELKECDCTFCRRAQGCSAEDVHSIAQDLSARLINAKLKTKGLRPLYEREVPEDLNAKLREEILEELDA